MPQIAQQDYKVIAPKSGRAFDQDATALGEIKKAILNGIGFDCLIKDTISSEGDINRVLGFYSDSSRVEYWSVGDSAAKGIDIIYTITQYQGLSAVQEAIDELEQTPSVLPNFILDAHNHLMDENYSYLICVDGKYLTVTGHSTIDALTVAETGPTENFINITWEDAQKLIGLLLS